MGPSAQSCIHTDKSVLHSRQQTGTARIMICSYTVLVQVKPCIATEQCRTPRACQPMTTAACGMLKVHTGIVQKVLRNELN